jgi:hypothetical protein
VVEVEGALVLDSWVAIFVYSFVGVAAMVCSSATTRMAQTVGRIINDGRDIWYLSCSRDAQRLCG